MTISLARFLLFIIETRSPLLLVLILCATPAGGNAAKPLALRPNMGASAVLESIDKIEKLIAEIPIEHVPDVQSAVEKIFSQRLASKVG